MARTGLSHALPVATTEQVLEAALEALLEKQARRKGLGKRAVRKATEAGPLTPRTRGGVQATDEVSARRPLPVEDAGSRGPAQGTGRIG